ncbi:MULTISPECIES: S41 family peptidase [Streptomyces]|uniref:S41 family peptidase n=1 Tax=Streptomyces TaxID=1883 RepID=UPI001D13BBB2|nr:MULTISPECIES: S41 family peptidase [Streptomyces]MCC3653631.1 PDZ domain-containing protein [Streptomyces sp. S07_1.15]WSQ71843.1 S41 family peptidase [Streptomyces xinghaiensis]
MSGSSMFVPPRRLRRGAALTLVLGSVLVTGGVSGIWQDDTREHVSVRADAVADTAGEGPDEAAVAEAAAAAMAAGESGTDAAEEVVSRSGDRWSAVYSAGEYEGLRQSLDGWYVGVGIWVRHDAEGRIEVARALPGSPADRAGIRPGDGLRAIDGEKTGGQPVTEVVALLRGDDRGAGEGSSVELDLERGDRRWRETLTRTRLAAESVTVRTAADGTTLIEVGSFTKGSGEEVVRAVRKARDGAGVLLDLRGNPGGLVGEAVTAASAFLDGGLVATYDVHGEQRALHAEEGGAGSGVPLVVLVDGGTMSSAELLAGALQDRGRAVVVGTETFGKGSVQMPEELPDGSVAELTVGHYRTPSGRSVDGEGITPDLVAREGAEERARTVLTGLAGGS